MNILVTGGAGYIGSFMTKALLDREDRVVVVDSLERGSRNAVDRRASFVKLDIRNLASLEDLFCEYRFDAVFHFAGYIAVEESSKIPQKYYENNVVGSKNLFISAIRIGKVKKFVFSSSAAVYGNPVKIPIPESHPKNPTSIYGENKLAVEKILGSLHAERESIGYVCLRYFNASGAALDGSMGENHDPETHIIPLVIQAALNETSFNLFGTDYKTPDGTCVRDYIHVLDLIEAHMLALEKLKKELGGFYYNVGTGQGYSNRHIIDLIKKVSGKKLTVVEKKRRMGDPDQLVADPTNIKKELGFKTLYSDIETIIESAWKWHKKQFEI